MDSRDDKAQKMNPPYRPYTHRNPDLNIFLDLLWDLLISRGLSDSQSYDLNFSNDDRWAKAHAMLRDVRESIVMLAEDVG